MLLSSPRWAAGNELDPDATSGRSVVPVTIHTGSVRTIGEVAQEYGVTVRTLHHYDGIGLLTPSQRSDGGYRLYTDADQRRLAAIVGYRRLGGQCSYQQRSQQRPFVHGSQQQRRCVVPG